jgi:hypothetical protein
VWQNAEFLDVTPNGTHNYHWALNGSTNLAILLLQSWTRFPMHVDKSLHICYLFTHCRLRLKCDGTRAETRFRLSAKRMNPFKSAGASVQTNTGSRGVRICGSNAGYTIFRGSVKSTGHPRHSPVSPSLPPSRASPCAITFQLDSTFIDRLRNSH